MLIFKIYKILPSTIRNALKTIFATSGHGASWADSLKARRDAKGKKNLSATFARCVKYCELANVTTLAQKRTLDFGCGYVISDAVVMWLLGAQQSYAADYNAIADFKVLSDLIKNTRPEEIYSTNAITELEDFKARYSKLQKMQSIDAETLRSIGIIYTAPLNILDTHNLSEIDLIISTSVLEHIDPRLISKVLVKLESTISPTGRMIHEIHLEDHFDIDQDPYGFLKKETTYDPNADYDMRGNRISLERWQEIFESLNQSRSELVAHRTTSPRLFPPKSDLIPQLREADINMLKTSHATFLTKRTV